MIAEGIFSPHLTDLERALAGLMLTQHYLPVSCLKTAPELVNSMNFGESSICSERFLDLHGLPADMLGVIISREVEQDSIITCRDKGWVGQDHRSSRLCRTARPV